MEELQRRHVAFSCGKVCRGPFVSAEFCIQIGPGRQNIIGALATYICIYRTELEGLLYCYTLLTMSKPKIVPVCIGIEAPLNRP